MSSACTLILVGGASPVSEILVPSKTAKFPFLTMGYSPWSSKNLIDQNRLKKFMQIGIDVICMQTYFGGCGLFSFGDLPNFSFSTCNCNFFIIDARLSSFSSSTLLAD